MTKAIFQNTWQALHVSFLIMSMEPRQDGPLRKALLRIMESIEEPTKAQREWMEQLRGQASGTVNFEGLTGDEIRAQCALVTQAVKSRLPKPEMWVLQAKYGATEHEDVDGKRRFAFSAERIDAIKGLSDWLQPSFKSIPGLALDCIIAKLFANHAKTEISFRDLAKSFGSNHMTYSRAFPKLKAHVRELEDMAVDRLTPWFEEQGVIEKIHIPLDELLQ